MSNMPSIIFVAFLESIVVRCSHCVTHSRSCLLKTYGLRYIYVCHMCVFMSINFSCHLILNHLFISECVPSTRTSRLCTECSLCICVLINKFYRLFALIFAIFFFTWIMGYFSCHWTLLVVFFFGKVDVLLSIYLLIWSA